MRGERGHSEAQSSIAHVARAHMFQQSRGACHACMGAPVDAAHDHTSQARASSSRLRICTCTYVYALFIEGLLAYVIHSALDNAHR
eukprot:1602779-Pyramimonas_sp.AAC.1